MRHDLVHKVTATVWFRKNATLESLPGLKNNEIFQSGFINLLPFTELRNLKISSLNVSLSLIGDGDGDA